MVKVRLQELAIEDLKEDIDTLTITPEFLERCRELRKVVCSDKYQCPSATLRKECYIPNKPCPEARWIF